MPRDPTFGKYDGTVVELPRQRATELQCTRLAPVGAASLPPRPWAYGNFMLFGSAAVIGAADGSGKGAIAVVMALAMITGQPLLGERVWRTGPVAIITYEDDQTEWHRRIAAACKHYALDYETIMANIYFLHRPDGRVSFAAVIDGEIASPDGEAIIRHLKAVSAVLLIIDPFNHAHSLDDGNSNVLIARVAGEMSRIAMEAHVAVLVLHHLRKGSTGSVDDLMGATSLRATFRSCRILTRMTKEEADALKIADRWRHIRIVGSKENYAPPPDLATWFKLESVRLGNSADVYPDGDEIGVATTWTAPAPPSAFDELPLITIEAIFDRMRRGPGNGEFYSMGRSGKAERWVGAMIMVVAGKSEEDAAKIIAAFKHNGVLIEGSYMSPAQRKEVKRVTLNEAKVAEILSLIPRGFDPDE